VKTLAILVSVALAAVAAVWGVHASRSSTPQAGGNLQRLDRYGRVPPFMLILTGTRDEIRTVARRYGIYYRKTPRGDVDHTFLTSIIDAEGILRVQYLGVRFDPDEVLRDIKSLVSEGQAR
jgi:cytochrome oxidase Cu insertion factor (SCO1/SenC/PrrC family)